MPLCLLYATRAPENDRPGHSESRRKINALRPRPSHACYTHPISTKITLETCKFLAELGPKDLEPYRLCSQMYLMSTVRRTDEHNLRQAISDILEQTYAIEYAMGLFYRKGSHRELERARGDVEEMRDAVERLREVIVRADQSEEAEPKVVEPAA
jgi:hypothetical protein